MIKEYHLKLKIFVIFSCVIFLLSCEEDNPSIEVNQQEDVLVRLNNIEGINATEIEPQNGGARQFEIKVEQPLDHTNPNFERNNFYQTVYLTYVDTSAPVVFNPSGYAVTPEMKSELSDLLNANDIHVGHRFFDGSKPANMDWQFLTIKQAADDHQKIVELLKPVFTGPWLSAGGSKSGLSTLFHRRYYPNDVKASVAFVTPVSRELQDPRYVEYIHTLGTEEEQTILKEYQRGVLLRRDDLVPKVDSFINTLSYTFSITASHMLEVEAFTFAFAYWQYYGSIGIEEVPKANSSVNEFYQFFEPAIVYLSDQYLDYFRPSYYQRFTEIGNYKPDFEYIEDLLLDFPEPHQRFKAPQGVEMVFDPSTVDDIVNWLENDATNIIYVYGELDPWTAGQIDVSNTRNCFVIVAEGQNHTLKLNDIPQTSQVLDSLTLWLGLNNN